MFFILIPIILPVLAFFLFLLAKKKFSKIGNELVKIMLCAIGITIVIGLLINGVIYWGATSKVNFKEVWNYKINQVEYYEDWNEKVSCRHPHYVTKTRTVTSTDSKGKVHYTTETYLEQHGYEHAYDVDYHPKQWYALDEYGDYNNIEESAYLNWKNIWGQSVFKDMHRSFHTKDGDMYYSVWTGKFENMFPWSSIRSYENRVRVSNSVFNYGEATKEQLARFPRPADENNVSPIISYGIACSDKDILLIRRVNAELGRSKRVHNLILLFDSSKDSMGVVNDVLTAWKGPNKNELVTFIGMDENRKIKWCDVQSWCDDTTIHAAVRNKVIEIDKFDSAKMANILLTEVPQYWNKKDFRDFSYLRISINFGWFILAFVLNVAASVVMIIVVQKQWEKLF
jgi:hypothetical protein